MIPHPSNADALGHASFASPCRPSCFQCYARLLAALAPQMPLRQAFVQLWPQVKSPEPWLHLTKEIFKFAPFTPSPPSPPTPPFHSSFFFPAVCHVCSSWSRISVQHVRCGVFWHLLGAMCVCVCSKLLECRVGWTESATQPLVPLSAAAVGDDSLNDLVCTAVTVSISISLLFFQLSVCGATLELLLKTKETNDQDSSSKGERIQPARWA
jgi:hypothetical protein